MSISLYVKNHQKLWKKEEYESMKKQREILLLTDWILLWNILFL